MPFILNRKQLISCYGLVGLMLLGCIFWAACSLWDRNEASSAEYAQTSHCAYGSPGIPLPDQMASETGATKETTTLDKVSRYGANKRNDTQRHSYKGAARNRLFVTLVLIFSSPCH